MRILWGNCFKRAWTRPSELCGQEFQRSDVTRPDECEVPVVKGSDLMHTQTVNFPSGSLFNIYVEEIPHKTTVYEHPRTMIFFEGPCDLQITREGDKVIVTGGAPHQNFA